MTSDTPSTMKPAFAPSTATTRMRSLPERSFDSISKRRRRSMIGTAAPRRFITPSTKAGALGRRAMRSGGRAISSTAAIGNP